MSYRRNNTSAAATTTHATRRPAHAGQRSYIVNIDTGSFADVEIIVGDYHHRAGAGVWAPTPTPSSRAADTVKVVTSKSHVYAYGMLLGISPPPIIPLPVLQPLTPFSPPSFGSFSSYFTIDTNNKTTHTFHTASVRRALPFVLFHFRVRYMGQA
jgi:hypothetical protein